MKVIREIHRYRKTKIMVKNSGRLKALVKSFASGLLTITILFGVFDYTLMRLYYYRVKEPGISIGIRI